MYEYAPQLKIGVILARSYHPERFVIAKSPSRKEYHAVLAVSHLGSPEFQSVANILGRNFEEVAFPKDAAYEVLDIKAEILKAARF